MANVLAPFGFRPIRNVASIGHTLNKYKIASGQASTMVVGDVVKSDGAGGVTLATSTGATADAILGVFAGWYYEQQGMSSANYSGSLLGTIPHSKIWTGGTTYDTGLNAIALVHDDPNETFEVQCLHTLAEADVGQYVNLIQGTANTLFGASRAGISGIVAGGRLTDITIGAGGSGYSAGSFTITRDASDPYTTSAGGVNGAATYTVNTGAINAITVGTAGFYSATDVPAITASGGTGATLTAVITATPLVQFRIERLLQKPIRQVDANNNTLGYGLSAAGSYALAEVKIMKHERGVSALSTAV